MKFIGKDGQEVELKILGYEFPADFDNEWDANWLRIYLKVKSHVGHWQTIDSSLLTEEVRELIKWFSKLAANEAIEGDKMNFIEPNLTFQLLKNTETEKVIHMKFDLESRPKFADDEDDYFVDFHCSNQELSTIANDLTLELDKFPFRPISSTKTASP